MKKTFLGFFDNYKAPILFTALLLISFFAEAQIYQNPTLPAKAEKRQRIDSTSLMPTGCGAPWNLSALDIAQKHAGQYYDSCNKRFYLYDPKTNLWDTLHIGLTSTITNFSTDQFNWKTITFPANSFTDSTLVNQLSNTTTRFNNGLILNSTESAISISSALAAWNYGFVINCPSSQKIVFQVLDSSAYVNVGIGIKAAQYAGLRHSLNFITANIGDSTTSYLINSGNGVGVTDTTKGVLINKFDYVEIQANFFPDSVVVYYHNLTNGTAAKVSRPVYGYSTTSYVSTMGYPTIFIARGHVKLLSYAIARQDLQYLFLGNSITAGYRANTIDSGFVGLLRNYTNAKITNGARSATSSIDYTKVKEELNFRNKVVFLSGIFGNDGAFSLDSTTSYYYYADLVNRLRANNNKIVHITNPYRTTFNPAGGWSYLQLENNWIRRTYGSIDSIVSIDSTLYATFGTDYVDGLHPSQSGHIRLAEKIYQTVPFLFERYKLGNLENIYNADGILTSDRILDGNSRTKNLEMSAINDLTFDANRIWLQSGSTGQVQIRMEGDSILINNLLGNFNIDSLNYSNLVSDSMMVFNRFSKKVGMRAVPTGGGGGSGVTSIATSAPITGGTITTTGTIGVDTTTAITGLTTLYQNSLKLSTSTAASTYLPLSGGTLTGNLTIQKNGYKPLLIGSSTTGSFLERAYVDSVGSFYSYGTNYTDASNYSRGRFGINGNEFIMTTEAAGTGAMKDISITPGAGRALYFGSNATSYRVYLTSAGSFISTVPFTASAALTTAYAASAVDITATTAHKTIDLTVTGKTVTLPTAVGITGRNYTIKLTASGTGTVATTSSQTIDGSTTYSLSAQYKYVTVQSNGANWIIIANN